jgi:hypothetical protein
MRITNLILFSSLLNFSAVSFYSYDDKIINDYNFRFTFKLSNEWETRDLKETSDKDGISYAFEKKNKKLVIQILAFKLSSVKNIDDFIYNIEKDISLNIPQKSGDYQEQDFGKYDMKKAMYKDNKYTEKIYYYRTKLPDSPNNYVYMLRFISENKDYDSATEKEIETLASGFACTAE